MFTTYDFVLGVVDSTAGNVVVVGDGTWGISGPDFLRLYALLAVGSLALGFLVRWLVDKRRGPSVRHRDLTAYELAFLNGGPRLAALTTLVSLCRRGIVVHRNQLLEVVDEADIEANRRAGGNDFQAATRLSVAFVPDDLNGIERATVHAIDTQNPATPDRVRTKVLTSEAMAALEKGLVDKGILRNRATCVRMAVWSSLIVVPVLLLGVIRLIEGARGRKPIEGLLFLVTLLTIGLAILATVGYRTCRSERIVRASMRAHRRSLKGVQLSLRRPEPNTDEAVGLALLGVGILWTTQPAVALALDVPSYVPTRADAVYRGRATSPSSEGGSGCASASSGGGCGGGSCGGGSSCGGGGCGGGGGGCGG